MKLNGFNNRNRRICESSEGRRRTDATYCVSGAGVVGAGVVDKRSDKRKGGVDKRGSDNHIADKRTDATCCVSTSGVSTSGVSSKCGADNHIVDKRTDAIFCVSTSGVSTSGVSTGVSALSLMKIFVMACMLVLSVNVFAKDFGGAFTADNLLRDVTWNEEKGRIEFKVMFYDNYGTERSEWIRQAEIYINNTKIGRIFHGCPGENSNGVVQEGWTTPSISPYNDYDYAALCFYSTSSSTTNRLAMYALGSGLACDDYVTSTSNYKEIPVTHDDNRWYTYDLNNRVSIADDPYTENHYYAEFYWYPGVVNVTDLGTVEISLRNIMVVEHISGAWMYPNNVFDEVDVTMPAATGHSMTGGLIGSEGKISFTCKADEATTIELVRSSSGYVPASQTGSNVTFDDKYVTSEDYFLNGRVFTFNSLRSVSDGKTVYVRRSDKSVITQRTGVFSDSLDASLETCGKVKLTWHIKNPSTTSNVNTQGFTLEVKKGDEGWTEISSGVPGYTATTASTSDYSYTYTIPESDRNKGTVNYEFRIKRAFAKWDDTSFFDYVQNVIIFQRNRAVAINTDFKQLTDIEIKPEGIDSYPRLTWNMAADGFECKDNITLKLKVTRVSTGTSTEINIPKDSIDKGGYHTSSVNGVENCVPQRYELILQYGSLPAITYIVSNSYLYQRTGKREFESIIVSKGYYADKNNIKWTLKKDYDEFDRFRLMRKEADQSDDGYVIVGEEFAHTRGKLQYETDDRAINAGVYYIYKIDGVHQCSDNIESLSSPVSIGFSQPYGSVSGRVTYTGSQAVKDVEIKVSTDNALNSNRELEFDSALSDSYLSIPAGTKLFNSDGFSFEAWLKFSASQNDTIVSNSLLTVTRGTDNRIRVRMANSATTVTAPATIANGEYAHLTVTVQKLSNYKSYNIKVYIGKTLSVSTNVTNLSADAATPTAATIIGKSFTGYLDDLRVWNTVLDSSAIALNYDRVLGGKESGLAAYYRFDEIDAAESAIFDCSAVGTAFNGNHATKGAEVNRSNVPVSASHLTIKGVTDANGNYSITNSIPYTSEGTIYTLLPSLGIHQFDPNNQPLYFSPDSKVFNNINFTDISSFPVSGQINYAGSSYPVEGVQISIDGLVASKDGGMVETDTEGKFTVDVPIGSHFISVSKHGHVFADGGRFPANSLEKYNFQTSVNGLTFTDNTTVRIMGKVVGGKPQSDKPLGFGLSSANIGQATVRLETVNNVYRLNLVDADSIVDNNEIGGVTSKTTFKHPAAGSEIEIETNPVTGEFLAVLPPVPYTLTYVKTADFTDTFIDGDPWDFEYSKTTFDVNPSSELTAEYVDSTGVKHEFVYHDSLKITRYNEPVIKVRDLGAAEGAFGDSIYVYSNTVLNTSDTVHLYSVNAGTVAYSLGYPVFSDKQGQYDWVITAYEEYRNRDDAANPVTDRVPLEGQEIAISNGLASQEVTFDYNEDTGEVGSQVSLTASESTVTLNENGQQRLRFNTSFPNLGGDHLLAVKMTLNQNGKEIVWNNNQPAGSEFKAYLFGQVISSGNNFVTKGPDMIDIVLPDPPGSYSYSYIEKGTSITATHSNSFAFEVSELEEGLIKIGFNLKSGKGIGFQIIDEHGVIAEVGETIGGRHTRGEGTTTETTYTFNERLATSGDMAFIGSDADVYIGRSHNRLFGLVRKLALFPTADDNTGSSITIDSYSLFPKEVTAVGDEFSTLFSYTQGYIVNTLIPNTKQLRNGLIRHIDGALPPVTNSGLNFVDEGGNAVDVIYLSNLAVTDEHFGEKDTYTVYFNPTNKKVMADEVAAYNNWIALWEKSIEDNEKAKIGMFDKRSDLEAKNLMYNRSFNAGVNIAEAMTTEYSYVEMRDEIDVFLGSFSIKAGYTWNDLTGFEVGLTVGRENTWQDTWEDGQSASITFGYELSEDGGDYLKGTNDAITVDVYKPVEDEMKKIIDGGTQHSPIKTLRGFTFRTRAGQTSCPFEPADSTLFYTKNGKKQLLNYGTFQIEKSEIYINSSKSASEENIPAGREATFTVQMQNMSETKNDVAYQLSVGDYSNLNGLILSIDGTPLTEPREYTVEYGEELVKTLKVRQSSQDILEYSDIELVLSSTCEDSDLTSSSAKLSVKFIPSSSPVTLVSNSRLANVEGLNNGGKIQFTVSDYDRSYKNFGCIRLQYRDVVNENWITLREYVNDELLYPVDSDSKEKIAGPTCTYDFTYSATVPSDGEYIFRAVSVSKIGTDEITFNSEEIRVVKDIKAPQVMGYPSPVNGILNAGDEISVTFNEEIQSGKLVDGTVGSNFSITGVLNGDIREEPTSGIAFSGLQSAYTELPIYTNGSFSIETWFKRTNNTAGTLFAYGSGNDYISLGFDATGHVVVTIGDESSTSVEAIDNTDDTWKYIGLAYDRAGKTVSVNAYQGTQTLRPFQSKAFTNTPATQGKLYLGNNASGNSGFNGAAALLHFYNFARSEAQMTGTKSLTKSGTENGLIGLWELEEDEGALAKDKARSRHLTLNNTSRYIYPIGKAPVFNGVNQYARIASGMYPFDIYSDFTFEFWFKGGEQDTATLLSVGTETYIGFDTENRLTVTTGDASQILAPAGLLDDKWHHFALSVKRNGMARASIDGVATASFNSAFFGNVGGGYYHLGVKYVRINDYTYGYSEYFDGNIDELRVWNSALTTEAVAFNKNHSLNGDEAGLKAYYPFEKTEQVNGSVYSVNASLDDKIDGSLSAALFGSPSVGDVSAPLQLARQVKDVPYTFTASDTKIVLNLTEEEYRIDGVTLYVSVVDVLDMHDNRSGAINWIAYVNRNALNWNTDLVDIIMEDGETRTFKAYISNNSGEKTDYFIEDLPSWLSVDAPQGSLNPLAVQELTFTIATGVNIGAYEASVVLTGTNSVKKILPVTLKVTGDRPDWSVNPADFESSMTVVGQLFIKDFPQEDPDDLLAAFIGNTCVGLVSPKFEKTLQTYLVYMQIWGNIDDNGQNITFKIWDASTGNIYPIIETTTAGNEETLQYSGNSLQGTPYVPVKFNALDAIEQALLLNTGWNWISFSVKSPNLADVNDLMQNINNGIEIKGQQQGAFSRYVSDNNLWTNGKLTGSGFNNVEMYMIKTSGANTISLPGTPVNVDSTVISLNSGWNWISYTPQVNETVTEAFAGANPQGDDIVKSQTAFSVYAVNIGWVGTLEYLRPGQGYMYNTLAPRSFKYPKTGIMTRSSEGDPIEGEPLTLNRPHPSLNSEIARNYESNLSLIGEVRLKSDILSETSRLIAYADNEPRGIAEMKLVNDKRLFFLPIYSNFGSETITFAIENNGKEIPLREYITYKPNALLGTVNSPMLLTDANIKLKVYPNPFIDRMTASFEIEQADANVRVELISMDGKVIYSTKYTIAVAGPQLVDIDAATVSSLTPGTYIIRVTLNDNETFTNVIIKGVY